MNHGHRPRERTPSGPETARGLRRTRLRAIGLPALAFSGPLLAAALALLVSDSVPLLSALLLAMVIGAVLVNLPGKVASAQWIGPQEKAAKVLLRLGIVALGFRLPLQDVVTIGWAGGLVVVLTVALTFAGTLAVGRRLAVDRDLVVLVAAGFSICGAAAIAAVSDVIRARREAVALSIAMVTVFGSLMIVLVPWLGTMLSMDEVQVAAWIGASIHEVAQVAAAASLVGGGTLASAMLVKLGRVAMLGPVSWLATRTQRERPDEVQHVRTGPWSVVHAIASAMPWFLWGFVAAVLLRTVLTIPAEALQWIGIVTTVLLAAGMYGLGLGLRLRDLWPVPRAVLGLAAVSTTIALLTSLSLILLLL